MNHRQKIAILFGTGLAVLAGLFPPHIGTYAVEGDDWRGFMGYYFIFSPPSAEEVSLFFFDRTQQARLEADLRSARDRLDSTLARLSPPESVQRGLYSPLMSSSIDLVTFIVEIITILLATTGAVLLLSRRESA